MHSRLGTVLFVALVSLAGACGSKSEGEAGTTADARSGGGTQELVETLSLLSGDALTETAIAGWVEKIDAGESTTDELIESLITSSNIGERVAPNLLFTTFLNAKNYYAVPSMYTLKQVEGAGAAPIFYLRDACTAEEAVDVNPWWDLGSTIKVCPDSYRPERWTLNVDEHSYRTRMVLGCDGQVGSPEKEDKPLCGCGPNMIRCLKDTAQYLEMHDSMAKEIRETTAYVVNHDMKLSKLFTSNQTVRDRNAEYLYQRRLLGALEGEGIQERIRSIRKWPEDGIWSKREELVPGQHAGVLTSHQLLNWAPDRRQRQRVFYEVMWCEGRDSFGATTEKIFEVADNPNLAFTHDAWERLANTEICTKCHARLDYGFQFFMGYPDGRATGHIMPDLVREGSGPIYGKDIHDSRGEARLTPASFARHVVKEPEYFECMASQISNYVLGPDAPIESHEKVLQAFKQNGQFRQTMGTALRLYVERFKQRASQPAVTVATSEPALAPQETKLPESITPSPELSAMLEEHCVDCHDNPDLRFKSVAASYGLAVHLAEDSLSRPLAVRMLDQVAYSNMPRGKVLPHPVREAFVTAMVEQLWPAGAGRETALDYYLGQMRSMAGHQIDVALQSTRDATGIKNDANADTIHWGTIERSVYSDQNVLAPGYLTILALESAEDCRKSAGSDETAFTACLENVLNLGKISR